MTGRTGTCLSPTAMALLFLLAGVAATRAPFEGAVNEMGLKRTLITDGECITEGSACLEDASCQACDDVFQARFYDCYEYDVCTEAQEQICCMLEDEDEDCENNTKFSDLIGAFAQPCRCPLS